MILGGQTLLQEFITMGVGSSGCCRSCCEATGNALSVAAGEEGTFKSRLGFKERMGWILVIVVLGLLGQFKLYGNEVEIFNTPTALSLEQGEFSIKASFYKDGGVLLRVSIGAHSYFNIGILDYLPGIIGTELQAPELPHAYMKIRIPFHPSRLTSFDIALGYDAFYRGNFKLYAKDLYGFYVVATLGLPWFKKLVAPHYFSFGVRVPVLFENDIPDIFASFLLRFHEVIKLATELSNIHFGQGRYLSFLNNTTVLLSLGYGISVGSTFQVAKLVNEEKWQFGLGFSLEYSSFF